MIGMRSAVLAAASWLLAAGVARADAPAAAPSPAASSAAPAAPASAPRRMALKEWFTPSQVDELALSPDGRRLVGIGGWPLKAFLQDAETGKTTLLNVRTYAGATSARHLRWITDELLAVDIHDGMTIAADLSGNIVQGLGRGYVAKLKPRHEGDLRVVAYPARGDGLETVDLRSGERSTYRVSVSGDPLWYGFDERGVLRLVTTRETGFWSESTRLKNWYRADDRSDWQLMEEGSIADDLWMPFRVLPEPGQIAVYSRKDRDTYALFRYDTTQHRLMEMMAGHPTEDFALTTVGDDGYFQRVTTSGIKPQTHWFDARWAGVQRAVDGALPGRVNIVSGDPQGRVLVFSYGDVDPGRWILVDLRTSKMREIGEHRPDIDPARMRPMDTVQYAARDGLTVNAYLTRPAQAAPGPAPTVVLIHGGPHVRDRWTWDPEVQLLAAQGYAVFQPQFRGSAGFGKRFERAGHRQWGLAMSDDITDGVQWLVQQKISDPLRICIYGASYGGYAALWGVIKTPQLYRCGASMAGVSDLTAAAAHSWQDDSTATVREFHRLTLGDADKDKAQLDAVSPIRHVADVHVPLFIAHGELDRRVLPAQSERLVAALKAAGKPVEWMPFAHEGHGLYWTKDRLAYYTRLLAFLHRHIGGPDVLPPPDDKPPS